MENPKSNPLFGYFRQPAIYLTLPSQGQWWEQNSLDLPANGEIPVYPMTAKDEIVIRTPDALLNGQGIVDVIQSCCPNIQNAWKIPSIDLDPVLISIRIATYGNSMNFESQCPTCKESNSYEVDLGSILGDIASPDFSSPVPHKGLTIKLKPQLFEDFNRNNMINYEEQKMMDALGNSTLEDNEKARLLRVSIDKIIDLGITACAASTEYIEIDSKTRVTDQTYIKEFYANAENEVMRLVQERIKELNEYGKIKPMKMHCTECDQEYEAELTFDYANFFDKGF